MLLVVLPAVLLSAVVPTVCGLNPREFRLLHSEAHRHEKVACALDGTLLFQYLSLDCVMQDEIAAAMGVGVDLLLETLGEIDNMGMVF